MTGLGVFFFSSRRRHTRYWRDWSSDVCSSDLDGQGNFGTADGDEPAAMRYTEARLNALAMELLRDIDKETVDFTPNYDNERSEEHTSELQSRQYLVCRLLLEKKNQDLQHATPSS